MNLGTMGAAGMDPTTQQIAASSTHPEDVNLETGQRGGLNVGLISAMANV